MSNSRTINVDITKIGFSNTRQDWRRFLKSVVTGEIDKNALISVLDSEDIRKARTDLLSTNSDNLVKIKWKLTGLYFKKKNGKAVIMPIFEDSCDEEDSLNDLGFFLKEKSHNYDKTYDTVASDCEFTQNEKTRNSVGDLVSKFENSRLFERNIPKSDVSTDFGINQPLHTSTPRLTPNRKSRSSHNVVNKPIASLASILKQDIRSRELAHENMNSGLRGTPLRNHNNQSVRRRSVRRRSSMRASRSSRFRSPMPPHGRIDSFSSDDDSDFNRSFKIILDSISNFPAALSWQINELVSVCKNMK